MSNNFLGPFSYFWAVSHPLSRTFEWGFRMNQTVQFRHSNVNNCIDKTLFRSLFSFFSTSLGNNMSPVKWKLNVKSLGETCQALRDLEKSPQTKMLVKNMMHPVVKPSSVQITNTYSAEFVSFSRSWKRYVRAFAKIRILACAWHS